VEAIEGCPTTIRASVRSALQSLPYIRALFVTRHRLALEAAALRQQLVVFKRKQPRPGLKSHGPALLDDATARIFRLD
jgi:hypothetical protein